MKSSPQVKDRSLGKCRSNEGSRYARSMVLPSNSSTPVMTPSFPMSRSMGATWLPLNFSSSLLRLPSAPTAVRSLSSSKCSMTSVSSAGASQQGTRQAAGNARRRAPPASSASRTLPFGLLESKPPIQELLCRVKVRYAMRQYQRLQGNRSLLEVGKHLPEIAGLLILRSGTI